MQNGYAKNHWVEAGGKSDCVLEIPGDTVLREVEEETGLQRQELELISVWPAVMNDRQTHVFIFEVDFSVAEAAKRRLAGMYRELDPLRWFDFYKGDFRAIEGGNIHMKTRAKLRDLQQQLFPVPSCVGSCSRPA
jgi:8-oxo-dGTP pyrophosphatase MutT (NUDIX family)